MNIPEELLYSRSHEWVRVEDDICYIGLSDHAQHELGDIVYIELPEPGDEVSRGNTLGAVDSVKASSEIYVPISGTIEEINSALEDTPELINEDPYKEGWLVSVKFSNPDELKELLSGQDYLELLEEEK